MDIKFWRFVALFCVLTGPVTCNEPPQTPEDDTGTRKHTIVEENLNYLVPNESGKRRTPPDRHFIAFEKRGRLTKRSESSSGLRSGKLSSRKISDSESSEIGASYRTRKLTAKKSNKSTENNKKYGEYTKQISGRGEDKAQDIRVKSVLNRKSGASNPAIMTRDQGVLDLPIYETHNPSKQQNEDVDQYRYYANEKSRDSSQSSDETRKEKIKPNQSATENSGTRSRGKPRKRPRTKNRNSSIGDDSSGSAESVEDSPSVEDHTIMSKDSSTDSPTSTTTHFFTSVSQSVDVTAPPTVTSSSDKVTTAYSTSKLSFETIKPELTHEILNHRITTTEVSGVITSSSFVTAVSEFPKPSSDRGNRTPTPQGVTTRAFVATKFTQSEARKATTTAVRPSKPPPRDPITIGPIRDFIDYRGNIPLTIVGVVSASIIAVALVATSSFIGSRRSFLRGRSPSISTLPENIELHDA